jgi:hypothetical protein
MLCRESRPPLWSSYQSSWLHNGYVLWFLWGTNWIYICYVEESRQLLWSSGQSSWLHRGDVFSFLWRKNWIYICYVQESRPLLWSSGQSSWLHNGDVLCFLWGTNWIYICYVEESRQLLWSSDQSSWLQIQRSGFDFRRYQIFWEVMGLERDLCEQSFVFLGWELWARLSDAAFGRYWLLLYRFVGQRKRFSAVTRFCLVQKFKN